ncbi:ubiquitin [Selaginella moellendorffii]|uniref:ubiquitin n=1 Tax=Selaginella moellendorffii TaxID=88036 RepID=UPI000D1D0060|nr:ubiquitin [Selaginella moellendorffii]|eukprot:XP_002986416.2 ubiquitin [Selaginella moellendorffii]
MSMFIRVKRKKTTYFLHCDPSETVLEIKQKLQALSENHVDDQRLILIANKLVLEDHKTLADQKVENDAIVAMTLKIRETGDWEEVAIDKPGEHPKPDTDAS